MLMYNLMKIDVFICNIIAIAVVYLVYYLISIYIHYLTSVVVLNSNDKCIGSL